MEDRNRINFLGGLGVGGTGCENRGWGRREKRDRVSGEKVGEMAGTEGHLSDDMETRCSRNFLKQMKMFLMMFPNIG